MFQILLSHTQRQISTFYRGRFVLLVPNWQYDLAASAIAVIASSRKKVVAFTDSIACESITLGAL